MFVRLNPNAPRLSQSHMLRKITWCLSNMPAAREARKPFAYWYLHFSPSGRIYTRQRPCEGRQTAIIVYSDGRVRGQCPSRAVAS